MSPEPVWLSRAVVEAIQADQVRRHGGLPGLRDEGLLESALARPQQRWIYEPGADLADLAAAYAFGIVRNHPFLDGNKRIGFMAAYTFLGLNGRRLVAPEAEAVIAVLALAAGERDEAAFAAWLRANSEAVA